MTDLEDFMMLFGPGERFFLNLTCSSAKGEQHDRFRRFYDAVWA